jgi:hypothetical protein
VETSYVIRLVQIAEEVDENMIPRIPDDVFVVFSTDARLLSIFKGPSNVVAPEEETEWDKENPKDTSHKSN